MLTPHQRHGLRRRFKFYFEDWCDVVACSTLNDHEMVVAKRVREIFRREGSAWEGFMAEPLNACIVGRLNQPCIDKDALRSLTVLSTVHSDAWILAYKALKDDLGVQDPAPLVHSVR